MRHGTTRRIVRFALPLLLAGSGAAGQAPAESAPSTARVAIQLRSWASDQSSGDTPGATPGQPRAPRNRAGDDPDAIVLGRLLYGQLDVLCEDAPLRSVLSAFAQALDVNVVAFYASPDRTPPRPGVRAREPIDLELRDVDARSALEAIAAQAGHDVTWQIHRGILEFGPREALARESGRRIQVYEIADLGLQPPNFVPPKDLGIGLAPMSGPGEKTDRLRPADVIADLVRMISEQCEPQAFEPAPEPDPSDALEGGGRRPAPLHTAPSGTSRNPRKGVNTTATRNLDPDLGPVFVRGQWATIHVKHTTLVVNAPDFVHRAIGGSKRAIVP